MSASEFAFLALGLVLGVASGAALIEVFRARPPLAREVRLTVAPNAIQPRHAATLADPHAAREPAGPARGGPGDRRWRDEIADMGEPAATGRRVEDQQGRRAGTGLRTADAARSSADSRGGSGTRVRSATPAGANRSLVAVPMSNEPDPMTAALRASAAAGAQAAMSASARVSDREPMRRTTTLSAEAGGAAPRSAVATEERAEPTPAGGASTPARGESAAGDGGATTSDAPAAGAGNEPGGAAAGPCAEERRVADERCAVAGRAREGAAAAVDAHRLAQRTYDDHVARAEAGATQSDPRAIRAAKEQAQQRFRDARTSARTRDDVETGARDWLAEINRINHEMREAAVAVERDRAVAAALAPDIERLAVEADAARIAAERADEACIAAREAVAECDEARTLDEAAARAGATPSGDGDPDDQAGEDRIAAATPEPEDEFAFSTPMRSQAGDDALILRILRGDREAMQGAVARLAGNDPDARRRWQTQLGGLAEALIARSIEATAFDFPIDHPFWGPFNQSQNRDIAAGLSSLGFRFDGFGGWVDDRLPSQRDLSLAVGYAGLDPMRVRRWPTEAETRDLFSEVRVAADEYVAGAAGGLTLGELITLLGRRADGLTELWNDWGSVRPILLEAG